jgi:PST family polysaccharide transporter
MLIACIFAGSVWGGMGVTVGYTLGLLVMWPLSVIWIAKVAPQVPAMELFNNALRAILGYGAAGVAAYFAAQQWGGSSLWQQLAVGALAMALGCVLVFALWPAFRRDVMAILNMRTLLRDARAKR